MSQDGWVYILFFKIFSQSYQWVRDIPVAGSWHLGTPGFVYLILLSVPAQSSAASWFDFLLRYLLVRLSPVSYDSSRITLWTSYPDLITEAWELSVCTVLQETVALSINYERRYKLLQNSLSPWANAGEHQVFNSLIERWHLCFRYFETVMVLW